MRKKVRSKRKGKKRNIKKVGQIKTQNGMVEISPDIFVTNVKTNGSDH